jgi:DNA-binding LacI/PurR family transcriptional regulator
MKNILSFAIDRCSSEQLYLQFKKGLRESILKKKLKIGAQLPPVLEMSKSFKLSIQTVQDAINELKEEGYLYSRLGKGIFVAPVKHAGADGTTRHEMKEICFLLCNTSEISPLTIKIMNGIEKETEKNDIRLHYGNFTPARLNNIIKEEKLLGIVLGGMVNPKNLEAIKKTSLPFILVGDVAQQEIIKEGVDMVVEDEYDAVYLATSHLIGLGHRKIALVTDSSNFSWVKLEIEAFEKAHIENRIKWNELLKIEAPRETFQQGYSIMKELLKKSDSFSAVISMDEILTYGMLKLLNERKVSIPRDISFIGRGDPNIFHMMGAGCLGSIEGQFEDMGRVAVKQLIRESRSPGYSPGRIAMQSKLVLRGSTGKPDKTKGDRS